MPCAGIRIMRLLCALAVVVSLFAKAVHGDPCGDPASTAAGSIASSNSTTTRVTAQTNMLAARDEVKKAMVVAARQQAASCPDPSTNSLCPAGFCFLYKDNNGDSAWATCCPSGWYLQLNAAEWSTQKCIQNGVSEPPVRPLSCGNTQGVISGWACVYANQGVNGVGTSRKWSPTLAIGLSIAWIGMWFYG